MRRPVPAALGAAAAVAVLILAAPALRLALVGRAELARGVAAQAAGDTRAALALYERAARCAFPFSPWSGEALARLDALGRAWEREGRTAPALAAAESLRGALLATGTASRRPELAAAAERRVVRLRLALAREWPEGGAPPPGEAAVRASLVRRRDPRGAAAAAGMLCFGLALAAVARLPRRWAAPDGARAGLALYGAACLLLAAALGCFFFA